MISITALDTIAFAACLVAIAVLIAGRSRIEGLAIKPALAGLLLLTLLQSVFLLVEWSGLSNRLDQLEDFVGALIPVWWGFVFYAFVLNESTRDLRRSEERMDLALRGADLGTWDWNVESGEMTFNERWAAMLGYSLADIPPTISTWEGLLHPDDRPAVTRALEAHLAGETDLYETEHRLKHRSGHWVWVLDKGRLIERGSDARPLRACGTHLDITERKKLQDQLIQSRKMESVGRLAGGVAHDLNNLLSPILGYGEMLQEDLDAADPRRESVNEMLKAGCRARDLVGQLLSFSRKQILTVKPVDVNGIIADFENLLRRTIPEQIAIAIKPSQEMRPVLADAGKIEQVILNLAVNAAQAMPDGGTLTIESALVEIQAGEASSRPDVVPGPQMMLAVSDTGAGMESEVVDNIFEPFFTTKGEQGTGLGLATAYGIVQQHGGNIRVHSERGRGTTFEIYLPITDATIGEEPPQPDTAAEPGGKETVLLAEDKEQVRKLIRTLLERRGFNVLVANNADDSLAKMSSHDGPIHLLLTDVIMPGLNGKELFERAAAIHPELRVLYMSGYDDSIVSRQGMLEDDIHFIQKPFSGRALAAKVREVLDR